MLQFMELQRVRHDLATKQQQQLNLFIWEEKLCITPVDGMKDQSQSSLYFLKVLILYLRREQEKKNIFSKFHVAYEKYCQIR